MDERIVESVLSFRSGQVLSEAKGSPHNDRSLLSLRGSPLGRPKQSRPMRKTFYEKATTGLPRCPDQEVGTPRNDSEKGVSSLTTRFYRLQLNIKISGLNINKIPKININNPPIRVAQ
jgi:hypothetical protein